MQTNHHNAKHAFFYLLSFFALGFSATAIGQVVFQLINKAFIETTPSYSGDYHNEVLRFAVSALIIAAPIYYLFTRAINKELAAGRLAADAAVRRWLSYLAIFIASAVAIGDLIFTLDSFLNGELTVKFLLKALTIFTIVGGFGGYYFFDLKRKDLKRDAKLKAFGITFIIAVLACLTVAFSLIDSPFRARELREDRERVSELQQISYAVSDYYRSEGALPQTLEDLVQDSKIRQESIEDPVSRENYVYQITDSQNYQLCANFHHPTGEEEKSWVQPEWVHEGGEQCFKIGISDNQNYVNFDVKPIPVPVQE